MLKYNIVIAINTKLIHMGRTFNDYRSTRLLITQIRIIQTLIVSKKISKHKFMQLKNILTYSRVWDNLIEKILREQQPHDSQW